MRREERKKLKEQIIFIFNESDQTYGYPRVFNELKKKGIACSENTVAKLMRELGLTANLKKKFKMQTTDSNHSGPIAPRLFKVEEDIPCRPNEVWAGDITYLSFNGAFLYLSVVLDIFTRKVIGWSIDKSLEVEGVIKAMKMAMGNNESDAKIIFHSDRGVQYASSDFRGLLEDQNLLPSMSRKGNCYDNAYVESFFKTLKNELIYRKDFKTEKELRSAIFEYIEIWYNKKRLHSSLGYLSPMEYEVMKQAA